MYIPNRVKDNWKKWRYQLAISTAIILLLLTFNVISVRFDKNPKFPSPPKVPAHIPFKNNPTWTPDDKYKAISTSGMVVSDSETCSRLGLEILKLGGNAADSAITTCLCIGATNTMFSSGIGGGAFITSKLSNETFAISIDAREMAPSGASINMFKEDPNLSRTGGLAVAIPGELMGLWTLFNEHGSGNLKWNDLIQPVANIAIIGWKIDIRLAFALDYMKDSFKFFEKDWSFLYRDDGELLKTGELMKRVKYGETLQSIGKYGVEAFYNPKGIVAQSLSKKAQEYGGIITAEDFGEYKVVLEEAIRIDNFTDDNLTVFTSNGTSSGIALASALRIIDEFGDTKNGSNQDFGVEETHKLIEAMKWLSSVRSNLGDINVKNKNETEIELHREKYLHFLTDEFVSNAASKFKSNETLELKDYEPAFEPNDPHGTSSLSIVDQWGNAVTLTTTINLLFGSLVHDPETGVILNNEMDDFSQPGVKNAFGLAPSVFNYIEPFKRPLSSSAQSIVVNKDGDLELIIGAAGGSRICTAILQAIVRTFIYGKDIVNVIANPRVHHQLIPNEVSVEPPTDNQLYAKLNEKGHKVVEIRPASAMNGIRVKDGVFIGQGDFWRKLGTAVGL